MIEEVSLKRVSPKRVASLNMRVYDEVEIF